MKKDKLLLLFITLLHVFSFQLLAKKSNYSELIANNANLIEQK